MARRRRLPRPARPTREHPGDAAGPGLARLRAICLALPEATEKKAWGSPTFRVRGKLFAMYVNDHHHDGIEAVWCNAASGVQALAVAADPRRYFVPPYVGPRGWIGLRLDRRPSWRAVADGVRDGYRVVAPKRLLAALDAS